MQVFPVRQLLQMSHHAIHLTMPDVFIIEFEDGIELESTKRECLYSSYFWVILNEYAHTPVKSTHHVKHVLKGKPLTSSTHIELLSVIVNDVVEKYQLNTPIEKEHILGMIYEVTNAIHNQVTKYAEGSVTSIDILDFIEVVEHPVIKEANDNIEASHESITKAYDIILGTINSDPNLAANALVMAIKSKMVSSSQVVQCISVRGFPTEVDGVILKVPILTNYTRGMNSLYNYVAESRSSAKALYFSEAPLQDAEYFARRLQLLSMTVEKISYTDCQTNKHLQWRVSPPIQDDKGNIVYPGDLKFMIGKYYLDEENSKQTNVYRQIKGNEEHLYNQVLKIRSVLFCEHPEQHDVCEVCFGALAKNVSRFSNLGHLCSATMTQQTSQSVLSTKHLDTSSVSANIVLSELTSKYLTTNRAKNAYLIKKELKDKDTKLIINREEAVGLTDILSIDDVSNINPIRVSAIDCIEISYRHKDEMLPMQIFVSQGNRQAILTTEFLKHLKTHRWETDSKNNFVFDLKHWDYSLPVMQLPDMEYSYSDHSHQIAKVIESSMKNITDRSAPHSPVSTLQELFSLVNTKLNVNIAALEVIIYATMMPSKDDYGMARGAPHPVLGIAEKIIKNRTMSNSLAYESQAQALTDPQSFFKMNRPSSVFDVFLAPREVIMEEKAKEARQRQH